MADPYSVLGVRRDAPDAEVRAAYRRLVKLHHPDHNQGSEESERRFEEVQEAYAQIKRLRSPRAAGSPPRSRTPPPPPRRPPSDPRLEDRLAALENQVQQARRARERAERAAREAARKAREAAENVRAAAGPDGDARRATDEELGYVTTDDTIGKILSDARAQLADRYGKARQHPVARRVSELIDGLEELTEKLDRQPKGKRKP